MGSLSLSFSHELKPKFKEFLVGHIVAMVTYCAKKIDRNMLTNDNSKAKHDNTVLSL